MTNHPGTVSEYGQGIDIFCVALGRAIITANETARNGLLALAGTTAGLYGNTANTNLSVGIAVNTAVWTSTALEQTITGILFNLQTAYNSSGGGNSGAFNTLFAEYAISNVIHYIKDRIFDPIGATSLFYGGGQMEKPVDCGGFGDTSSTDAYGFGCTGFSLTPYYINGAFPSFQTPTNLPEGRFDVEGDINTLFVDGGHIWGDQVAFFKGITAGSNFAAYTEIVRSHTSTLAKSRQYTYAILDIPYDSTLQYTGFIGAALCGKFPDYVKILKLVANKGVWEGKRLVGAAALEFILNPSVASDQNIQYFDQALFEALYGETVEPLDPADVTGFVTLDDSTWSYGYLVGDSFNNSKSTQRNPTFPFSSSNQIQWNGAFGTLWVVDLKTGIYFAAGTQQFVNNNFGLSLLYRVGVPAPTGPILAPTQASSYLTYISQYKPLQLAP
jgi:CubicO group peptidase (beta-lactamase class C family)